MQSVPSSAAYWASIAASRPIRRALLALVGIFVLAGLLAPWIDGSRWTPFLERSLQDALGRHVTFEKVHFTLFTGPGFSLENVTVSDDPRFGIEPFAFVPSMQVRLRPDRLLLGEIRFSTLRLIGPSLNLVKRSDETWNVLELVRRLGAPRRSPLDLFAVLEVEDARIDFKFGTAKTPLYLLDAGLAVYPERSGRLAMRFSGSPARTDRAGNGFGHFRGQVNWKVNAPSDRDALEADIDLEPSNLSELTTLIQGHDLGVHGTVSSQFHAAGPVRSLQLEGVLHGNDFHRWDLIPASSGGWNIRYGGTADLLANHLNVKTWGAMASPLALSLDLRDFLTRPNWTLTASMNGVALTDALPLGRRLGLNLPPDLTASGAMDGELAMTGATGISGNATLRNLSATVPGVPPLRAEAVNVAVLPDRIHFDPANLQAGGAPVQMGGDYFLAAPKATAALQFRDSSIAELKAALTPWLGMPPSLELLHDGQLSGQLRYDKEDENVGAWAGKVQFTGTTLQLAGLAKPLHDAEGRMSFDGNEFDVARFDCKIGDRMIRGSYRQSASVKRSARLRLELPAIDLGELQQLLAPTFEAQGWLARLHVARRAVPGWLAERDLEGELNIGHFLVDGIDIGGLNSRFAWRGTALRFPAITLAMPQGSMRAQGTIAIGSYQPHYEFEGSVENFPWAGGALSAQGSFVTDGSGADILRNLRSNGSFSGDELTISENAAFSHVAGGYTFSFANGWPNLHLMKVQAENGDGTWTGEGVSQSDGRLMIDLEHAGQQRHIVSSLSDDNPVGFLLRPENLLLR